MFGKAIRYAFLLAAFLLPLKTAAQDGAEPDPLAQKAKDLFAYEVGTWDSRWERLDADGEVISEIHGVEVFTYTLDDTALYLETRIDGRDSWSRAIKFYSPKEEKVVFIDVSTTGDYWMMSQDLETETVISEPNIRPDGSALTIRFTITRKTQNEQDVVMDFSDDGGETWQRGTRQYMRRRLE